ncbi:MAG TPA: hypothetical protein VIN10_10250 [Bacteroidales bacterium]
METPDQINKPKRVAKQVPSAKFGLSNNFIFIACILIATFAWLLIKLSDTYTVTYNFNLNYTDVPVDKTLTLVADSSVNISFTGEGFSLLRLELFSNLRQLRIQLKNYVLTNEKDNYYQLSTKDVKAKLSEETGILADNILFSKPYLGFEMNELFTKKVRVIDLLSVSFKEQYGLYGDIFITPQKISVFGPKSILDTLQIIYTNKIELNEVETDQSVDAELSNPIPGLLRFEPDQVLINFKVEKFTESSLEVPIDISEFSEGITLFPKTVKIFFKIAQKDFNNIDPALFVVTPETEGIDLNSANKLKLKIAKKPVYVRDEWLMPAEVEFLIIK